MIGRVLALAAACMVTAAAPPTEIRHPTGGWIVNFGDAQCVASRDYGTSDDPSVLVVKRPLAGSEIQLSLMTARDQDRRAVELGAYLEIDGEKLIRTTTYSYDPEGNKSRVFRMNIPEEGVSLVRQAAALEFALGDEIHMRLIAPQIESVAEVLDSCVDDLRREWHVESDGKKDVQLRRGPSSKGFDSLFTSRDLPTGGIGAIYQGGVEFLLLIDETGGIADCTVTRSSGYGVLDAQSCNIAVERSRFEPAIGTDGRPAKGAYSHRVEWKLGMEFR